MNSRVFVLGCGFSRCFWGVYPGPPRPPLGLTRQQRVYNKKKKEKKRGRLDEQSCFCIGVWVFSIFWGVYPGPSGGVEKYRQNPRPNTKTRLVHRWVFFCCCCKLFAVESAQGGVSGLAGVKWGWAGWSSPSSSSRNYAPPHCFAMHSRTTNQQSSHTHMPD